MKFGDCELQADGLLVTLAAQSQLSRRDARVLSELLQSSPIAVASDDLLDVCWGKGAGTPQQLAKAIHRLRHALADSNLVNIESVYGYGYRITLNKAPSAPNSGVVADAICEEAYHRLIKRRYLSIKVALGMFEEASRIDPTHVRARLGYAEAQFQLIYHCFQSGVHVWGALADAARDALALEPESAIALALLGITKCASSWNYQASDRLLTEALELEPWNPRVLEMAGRAKLFQGLHHEAADYFRRGLEVSPMTTNLRAHYVWTLTALGDIDAAAEEVRQIRERDPEGGTGHRTWFEAEYGNPEIGIATARHITEQIPASSTVAATYAIALAKTGQTKAARSLLRSFDDPSRFLTPACAVAAHAWCALGDYDAAVDALEASAAARDFWLGPVLWHPLTEPLHEIPAFAALREALSRGVDIGDRPPARTANGDFSHR